MVSPIKDKVAIVGIGEVKPAKIIERSELELGLDVAKACLNDSGVDARDVDGFVKYDMQDDDFIDWARNLGCRRVNFWSTVGIGGGAACGILAHAAMAVACGMAENVLCLRPRKRGAKVNRPWLKTPERVAGTWGYENAYGLIAPVQEIALYMRRQMHLYGFRVDHYGAVAVACRKHATTNPNALMRRPMTLQDHANSRLIADPIRLFDCGLENDGACVVLVTSAERAKNLKQKPIYITAAIQGCGPDPRNMSNWYKEGEIELQTPYVGKRIWEAAGVTQKDIDVALMYDVFSPLILFQLEDFGFCKKGESGPFVEDGGIEWPDGRLVVNPHGGSLSEAYVHGMNHIVEAVKQLRGTAVNQVENAEIALVTSGPPVPTSAMILRR